MGKHSASGGFGTGRGKSARPGRGARGVAPSGAERGAKRPRKIEHLQPATESFETTRDANRRRQRPDYHEMRRRRDRRRKIVLGVAGGLVGIVLLLVVGGLLYVNDINATMSKALRSDEAASAKLAKAKPKKDTEPFNMIIMGVDTRPGETMARSDTLIVAHFDPKQKRIQLLSIPRDTRVDIPGYQTTKINHAASHGGVSLVIDTVEEFTGLKINYYAEVDFTAFQKLVDALGGVDIFVPQRINDLNAASHNTNYRVIPEGQQHLNGGQALVFVRSRHYPEGDIQRIRNQQAFAKALASEISSVRNVLKLNEIVQIVAQHVTTNMPVGTMLRLAQEYRGVGAEGIESATVPGEPKMLGGVSYIIADEDGMQAIVDRIKAGESIEETAAASVEESVSPEAVSVAVRNGAGIGGVAQDAANRLTARKFVVGEVGNANQFVYAETLVVYRDGQAAAADAVKAALGQGKVVPSRGMYSFTGDVLVVVGKDWKPSSASSQ